MAEYSEGEEFEFANKLIDMGFKDYAKTVIAGLSGRDDSLSTLFDGRLLLGSGKFDEAETAFRKAADSPSKFKMLMRLGDVHWSQGRTEKTSELYEYVFSRYKDVPTKEPDRQFYIDSAYKLFKLMQKVDNTKGAIVALERVTAATTNETILRQASVDLANLKVDVAETQKDKARASTLKEVRRICDKVFFVPDKFFGDAVSVLVRVELLDDNYDRALALIKEYTPMCQEIEKLIVASGNPNAMTFSPMAGLRYQKGGIYERLAKSGEEERDGKKLQQNLVRSYSEYLNTFYKYKESEWGAESAQKIFEISDWAKKYGMVLEPEGGRAAIFTLMLESANSLYGRKQYKEASVSYKKLLDLFPIENAKSAEALKNLAFCYIHGGKMGVLNNEDDFADLMPQAIAGYLSDRFRGSKEAGDSIYKIGSHYLVDGQAEINTRIWKKFAEGFPNDPRSAGIYFLMAEKARKQAKENRTPGKREEAIAYYKIVGQEKYKDDIHYLKALDRLAGDFLEREEYTKAYPYYNKIRKEAAPGMDRVIAQFKLSNCLFAMEKYSHSLAALEDLRTTLTKGGGVFDSPPNRNPVAQLKENVLFRIGATYIKLAEAENSGRLEQIWEATKANVTSGMDKEAARNAAMKKFPPTKQIEAYWAKAVDAWDEQLTEFRKIDKKEGTGNLAPKALEGRGQIYMSRGSEDDIEQALKSYQKIAKSYPETPEAERVYYYLVREGIKLGRDDIVDDNVDGMINNPDTYSAAQLLQVGQLLVAEEKFAEGRQILNVAEKHEDTRDNAGVHQRVLKALIVSSNRSGAYQECVDASDKMLEKYEKTPYKFDVYRELANAHRNLKNCTEAINSIRWVFEYAKTAAKDPALEMFRANLELARIQRECGKEDQAVQSYWRLTLRPPPTVAQEDVAREGLAEGAAITASLGKFAQSFDISKKYLTWFSAEEGTKEYKDVLEYAQEAKRRLGVEEPSPEPEPAPEPAPAP